jgi:manganese/iron transport system ATP-binding protein
VKARFPRVADIQVQDASFCYGGVPALDAVNLSVPAGGFMAVVGPNGAGKSTLFKALVGLIPLHEGTLSIGGRSPKDSRVTTAYVPQREEIDWLFPATVRDVVVMGRYAHLGFLRRPRAADLAVVHEALGALGLVELANRPIGELSGGQQQRVFLARALAQRPSLLILDEPFTGVDASVRDSLMEVLADLHSKGVTVLVSTHDMELAASRFELVLLLNRRVVAYGAPTDVFTSGHIAAAFGRQAVFLNGLVVVDQCCPGPDHQH